MTYRIITALVLFALLPAAAAAQSPEARIEAAMARTQQAGIPVSLLESKIAEGRAKGVPMDRIAEAVDRRAAVLIRGRDAMGRARADASAADLDAAADALGSGVSAAVLQTISETAPRDRRAVAITALTELVAMGQVPQQALDRVIEALARGPEALASLPGQAAARGQGRRGAPADAGRAGVGPGGGAGQAGPPAGVPAPGERPTAPPGRPGGAGRPGGG